MTIIELLDAIAAEINTMTLPTDVLAQTILAPRYRLENLTGTVLATVTANEIVYNAITRANLAKRYRVSVLLQRKLQGPDDLTQDEMRETLAVAESIATALYKAPLSQLPRAVCQDIGIEDIAMEDPTTHARVFTAVINAEYQLT